MMAGVMETTTDLAVSTKRCGVAAIKKERRVRRTHFGVNVYGPLLSGVNGGGVSSGGCNGGARSLQ
jgi:hypothetical protein